MNISYERYNKLIRVGLIFCFAVCCMNVSAQQKNYTVSNAHAHNDYLHPIPFYTAFNAGFGSIEADVYPVNGILLVAHNKKDIHPQRTLKSLYIEPLLNELAKNSRHVKLLIDIKENYELSLQILLKEIEPLKKYLVTSKDADKPLTILISGERPPPAEYKNYPSYIFFDDDLKLHHTQEEWKRVGQVSLSFERYTSWKGENEIDKKDKKLLQHIVDSVHQAGKTIRFWAAPDNETSWKLQMKIGVDLIGTDQIDKLATFLRNSKKN